MKELKAETKIVTVEKLGTKEEEAEKYKNKINGKLNKIETPKIFTVLESYVEDGKMITKKELDLIKKEFQNG